MQLFVLMLISCPVGVVVTLVCPVFVLRAVLTHAMSRVAIPVTTRVIAWCRCDFDCQLLRDYLPNLDAQHQEMTGTQCTTRWRAACCCSSSTTPYSTTHMEEEEEGEDDSVVTLTSSRQPFAPGEQSSPRSSSSSVLTFSEWTCIMRLADVLEFLQASLGGSRISRRHHHHHDCSSSRGGIIHAGAAAWATAPPMPDARGFLTP